MTAFKQVVEMTTVAEQTIDLTVARPTIDLTTTQQMFVFAAVGPDHHPFDRFVEWMDAWLRRGSECEVFVQRGSTNRIPQARSVKWLDPTNFDAMMRRADAVVCHGGPSTIMEARRAGVIPVVIPRDPSRGEHVDGHQQRFTEFMAAKGAVLSARTEGEFFDHMERVLHGDIERVAATSPAPTLERISAVVDGLMARPVRPLFPRRGKRS